MANFFKYIDELREHEGGFVNHPKDPGGATNKGITLATWQRYGTDNDGDGDIDVEDLKLLTDQQASSIYKTRYWDTIWGDRIHSQSVAEIMFDHAVNAGPGRAVKMMQEILNRAFGYSLAVDGAMGNRTLSAINSVSGNKLYNEYIDLRIDYYNYRANRLNLVRPSWMSFLPTLNLSPSESAKAFINGWIARVRSFPKKKILIGALGLGLLAIGLAAGLKYRKEIKQFLSKKAA